MPFDQPPDRREPPGYACPECGRGLRWIVLAQQPGKAYAPEPAPDEPPIDALVMRMAFACFACGLIFEPPREDG